MLGRGLSYLLVLGLLLSAGCVSTAPASVEPSGSSPATKARPTVVALIDTGANPYHAAFQATPGSTRIEDFIDVIPAELVQLNTTGDYEARRRADDAFWSSIEEGKLYAFAGTRLMAVSMGASGGKSHILDYHDPNGHGVGTSGLVAREDPKALILMIQIDNSFCDYLSGDDCPLVPEAAGAMAWAAEQPWIDVISFSLGWPGNPPLQAVDEGAKAWVEASRLAHERGKILVSGTGNYVVPPFLAHYAGPPWVIAVGGAVPHQRGETAESSKAPDVVANYSDYVPRRESVDEYVWNSGTSFSTPIVAGTLSRALHEIRLGLHHEGGITPDGAMAAGDTPTSAAASVRSNDLWDALNASAIFFAPTEWDPTQQTNDTYSILFPGLPVVAPEVQMGWGYVHAGLADEIAQRVLAQDDTMPAEKTTAARYQAQRQALREAYWNQD